MTSGERTSSSLRFIWIVFTIAAVIAGATSSVAAGATYAASSETVVIGTSDGVNLTQMDDGISETLTEADIAPDPIVAPVAENLTTGVRVAGNFPTDLVSSNDAYVRYREAPSPPASIVANGPAVNGTGCAWSACADGRASDNASASSSADSDVATYHGFGFALPPDAANLRVEVGYEAYEPSGNDRIGVSISWDGGTSFCPTVSFNLGATDPDAFSFANLTACTGHTWSGSDFSGDNIVTRFTHIQVGGVPETLFLDANAVRVTYETNYRLEARYAWTAIPSANRHVLTVEGAISDENVLVEVLTPPSTWNQRLAFSSTTDQTLTYDLTTAEYNSGSPSVRFVDAAGADDPASEFRVDLVQITAVTLAYRLDVRQDVTGVEGTAPTLVIKGDAAPGENFAVEVWNFSAGIWNLRSPSSFAPTPTFTNLTLRPEEIDGGTVRVRYTDVAPSNPAPGRLRLDLVAVVAVPTDGPLDPLVLATGVGGAVAAGAIVLFIFVLRRKGGAESARAPRWRLPGLSRKSAPRKVLAPGGTRGVASVLESGRSYLVEEGKPEQSLKILEDLTRIGRSGFLVTQIASESVREKFSFKHTKSFWVADGRSSSDGKTPSVETIQFSIREFLETNPVGVVLVDDLQGLANGSSFDAVLRLVRSTAETVSKGRQILLASVRPGSLSVRGLKALERGMDILRLA